MSINVFGYGRASTDSQVLSTEQQEAKVRDSFAAYKTIKPHWSEAVWGGFMSDEATSRVSVFRERHFASLLLAACKPGDVILVSNFDRIFGSTVDVCETLALLKTMKISLVVLDMDIDTSTILGETIFTILAAIKHMEVREIRRRICDGLAHRRKVGRPHTGSTPIGWKSKAWHVPGIHGPQKYLVPDNAARRLARQILDIKQSYKLSFEQAYQFCNSMGLKNIHGRRWYLAVFFRWCSAAQRGFPIHNGSHDPAPIPADAVPYAVHSSPGDD